MVSPPAPARPHTDAVVAMAETAELLVGRGHAPAGGGWAGQEGASVFTPYAVLFPGPGVTDATLAAPHEYLDYTCQFNCVAATQEGAEAVADLVKITYVGWRLPVTGRSSYLGQILLDRPVTRDDSVAPPLHYAVLQIGWRTQPA